MKKIFNKFSKGKILVFMENKLSIFKVPKTLIIRAKDWKKNKKKVLGNIDNYFLNLNYYKFLAIRSSASNEDSLKNSNAGVYDSFLNVDIQNKKKIEESINKIISGYEKEKININKCEIIIQEMINNTYLSGVIFTHNLDNFSPYYVINYDDISGLTNTVTSGSSQYSNKSLYVYRNNFKEIKSPRFKKLILAVKELEKFLDYKYLDIEFACDKNLNFYLLQVRPIANIKVWEKNLDTKFNQTLGSIKMKFKRLFLPKKDLSGETTIYGQMPDWNPAEMIGKTPRILSYSLYDKLITSKVWALARQNMGYKKILKKNLMVSFAGQPYIDVRLSLNSFLPDGLPKKISNKLVDFWIKKLKNNPLIHDKIEFKLALTCFSFDIEHKIEELVGSILNKKEKKIYSEKLKKLTKNCIDPSSSISVNNTLKKIEILKSKQEEFKKLNKISDLKKIIEDCRNYGILPFSILARHAFISTTIINSFKNLNILTDKEVQNLFKSIKTITSEMIDELNLVSESNINKINFNKKYGHLRPGTYDLMSKRYDEKNYFIFKKKKKSNTTHKEFEFSKLQKNQIIKLLKKNGFKNISFNDLINYLKSSIKAREYSKFIFSKSISHILSVINNYSKIKKIDKKNFTNLPINFLLKKSINDKNILKIAKINEINHFITKALKLPQIIHDSSSAFVAPFQVNMPNFITSKKIEGEIKKVSSNTINEKLNNKIVLIEGADPGYDWIFTHKIKGLVTKFGGANSHMAIRSSEFDIPAAIGCGENIFNEIAMNDFLLLNCEDKIIQPI